jgi:hypothetical protein
MDFNRINKPLNAANTGTDGSSGKDNQTPNNSGEEK